MAFRQPSRDIATRIVYYYCMRLKSHTHIFIFLFGPHIFIFLFGLDYVYFYLLLVAR